MNKARILYLFWGCGETLAVNQGASTMQTQRFSFARGQMSQHKKQPNAAYFVGQKGEFTLLDSFMKPIETVQGEIVQLIGQTRTSPIYAMIMTERGIRPARLA